MKKDFLEKLEFVVPRNIPGGVRNGKRTNFNLEKLPKNLNLLSEIEKGGWYQVMISSFSPDRLKVFFITKDGPVILKPLFSRKIRGNNGKKAELFFWPTCRTVPEKGPRQVFVALRHKMGRAPILKIERISLGFEGDNKPFLQREVVFESFVSQKTKLPLEIEEVEQYLLDWVQE